MFALKVGYDPKCINFLLLASVLAGFQQDSQRHFVAQEIALGAPIVSVISLLIVLKPAVPYQESHLKSNVEVPARLGR